nr:MAG TPA: hypothetical protein [Caudoviricetes sp.]
MIFKLMAAHSFLNLYDMVKISYYKYNITEKGMVSDE